MDEGRSSTTPSPQELRRILLLATGDLFHGVQLLVNLPTSAAPDRAAAVRHGILADPLNRRSSRLRIGKRCSSTGCR